MLLGCIADDLTGATDLGGTLVREGLRVALVVGAGELGDVGPSHDAVVVALKSRSVPAGAAAAMSLAALAWLRRAGAERIFLKYASTFDSTPAGNIGPVTDALADGLDARLVVACPAYPANGRIVRHGALIVHGVPLADSPMRTHPLNPMTESSVVRLLAGQTPRPVGLVDRSVVARGSSAVRERLDSLARDGIRHAVADASDDTDLDAIAGAVVGDRLTTGASGLGGALARRLRASRELRPPWASAQETDLARTPAAVLAGSASPATRRQVEAFRATRPVLEIEPDAARSNEALAARIVDAAWASAAAGPVLIAARPPDGPPDAAAGAAIERVLGQIALGLVERGVRRLVVAGGETSGAVVGALGLRRLEVGREIEPGVPVVVAPASAHRRAIGLALKSGNFGSDRFFASALDALGGWPEHRID